MADETGCITKYHKVSRNLQTHNCFAFIFQSILGFPKYQSHMVSQSLTSLTKNQSLMRLSNTFFSLCKCVRLDYHDFVMIAVNFTMTLFTAPISASSLAESKPLSNDMNPYPVKRRRIQSKFQCLWESTWRDNPVTVPSCTLSDIVRDHSLSDDTLANGVPSRFWTMHPPKGIFQDRGVSGFLIREDYIVVLKHLFMAAEFDYSKIDEDWPEIFTNPFLNVLDTANDPKHTTKKGGLIITGHPGIGTPFMLYKIKG